jgi:phosphoglycerol transferase MdoB-like AlkP superfamily enzyme
MLIFFGGILFLGIRGGVGESTNNIGKVYHSDKQFLNHAAVNPIFSFIYSMGKREDYKDAYTFYTPSDVEARMKMLYPHESAITDTLLNTTRPNIITIILEGMGSALIESQGGIKGVTPNFDRLTKEGVIFTNCHANSYRTDRGVLCTLSGYASFPKTSVMKSPVKSRNLPSLASTLAAAGYHNTFLYGGDINFTNMKSYLYSTGYNELIADKDFTMQQQSTHLWGVTDHITFDSLYTLTTTRPGEPWHITYLTLSSHEPWTVPYNRIPDDEIANSFAYTDSCIGHFVDRLKKSEVWENTLVIMLPDHTLARYPQRVPGDEAEHNRIPILLLGGAVRAAKEITQLCNQSDLSATILAQLALPTEQFEYSRNILSPSYTYPFAYHTFNNGISITDSTGYTLYDLDAQNVSIEEPADATGNRITNAKTILQATYDNFHNR